MVDNLVKLPNLELVMGNGIIVASSVGTSVLVYMFSLLKTSDEGQYVCTATLNIPEANIHLQGSAQETLTSFG